MAWTGSSHTRDLSSSHDLHSAQIHVSHLVNFLLHLSLRVSQIITRPELRILFMFFKGWPVDFVVNLIGGR